MSNTHAPTCDALNGKEWSGAPNPANPANEWVCDCCGAVISAVCLTMTDLQWTAIDADILNRHNQAGTHMRADVRDAAIMRERTRFATLLNGTANDAREWGYRADSSDCFAFGHRPAYGTCVGCAPDSDSV